jgi:hypothetical protein
VLTVLALLLLGVAIGQFRWLPEGTPRLLDAIVVRFSLPALILAVLPEIDVGAELAVPVLAAWGTTVLLAVLVWLLTAPLHLDPVVRATLLLVVPLGNTSFLGFPAVEALLGASHLPTAVVYDQLGSFLALVTFGTIVAGRAGAGPRPTVGAIVRRVVTFPPFAAMVVAGTSARRSATCRRRWSRSPRCSVRRSPRWRCWPWVSPAADGWGVAAGAADPRPGAPAGGGPGGRVRRRDAVGGSGRGVGDLGPGGGDAADGDRRRPRRGGRLDAVLASRLVGVGVLVSMATLPLWAALVT